MVLLFCLLPCILFASISDGILKEMSLEQKIGQLFVAPACPLMGEEHERDWGELMDKYHVGGAILKQSDPCSQVRFLNRLQAQSEFPLLVLADAEWGLGMRMTDTIAYPKNMTLGAIQDLGVLFELGEEIGRQAALVGIHLNLAPVADCNNNPKNPIIHMRSFGEDPMRVADCVGAFAMGLQRSGVMACAKHFPGHGDTETDSHYDLPIVKHMMERLVQIEFVPFQRAIFEGIDAIMSAHLYLPAIDPQLPTSLSKTCLDILRKEWGFEGLIITDALNMKAIRYSPAESALLAHRAGNDLLLYGDHIAPNVNEIVKETIPRAFEALKQAYLDGIFDEKDLDQCVLRILQKKEKMISHLSEEHLAEELHTPNALALKQRLFQEAVTLIGASLFPIPEETAYLSFGEGDSLASQFQKIPFEEAARFVIAIHQQEALTKEVLAMIESVQEKAIVCLFTSPYALEGIKAPTILVGFENDPLAQEAVLNVLQGKSLPKGRCPVEPLRGSTR